MTLTASTVEIDSSVDFIIIAELMAFTAPLTEKPPESSFSITEHVRVLSMAALEPVHIPSLMMAVFIPSPDDTKLTLSPQKPFSFSGF